MNYVQIRPYDVANGPGIRVSIFVSGCTHACPNCFNRAYQDFEYGDPWTDQTTQTVIQYLSNPVVTGLSVLGGEPMQNLDLIPVLREIKAKQPKPIWLYSGDVYEAILEDAQKCALLSLCDVLVDGPFRDDLKDLRLIFRGSHNQRIIDVQASLQDPQKPPVLWQG